MTYQELKTLFRSHEAGRPKTDLTAYITFASFGPKNQMAYSWEGRTYKVSSDNKAFQPNKGGYSIFGSCLDGSDQWIRLDHYMEEEHAGKGGWVVEDCCLVGYLLSRSDDSGIGTPELFYVHGEAHDRMLYQLAQEAELNVERLKADWAARKHISEVDRYDIREDSAWLTDQATNDWKWSIQPVHIYSPLHITVGHD